MSRFGSHEILDCTFYKIDALPANRLPIMHFDTLKASTIETGVEEAKASGGRYNPVLLAWDYGRSGSMKITDALMSAESVGMLAGKHNTVPLTAGAETIHKFETLTVNSSNKVTLAQSTVTINKIYSLIYNEQYGTAFVAAGGSGRNYAISGGEITFGSATAAAKIIGLTTSVVTLTASSAYSGDIGNSITITLLDPVAANASEIVTVDGLNISVLLKGSGSAITSTGATVQSAINAHAGASSLVTASAGGAGVMLACSATALVSGAGVAPGNQVVVYYSYTSSATAKSWTIKTDSFPDEYKIIGSTIVKNDQTGLDEAFQVIIDRAKLKSGFTMNFNAEGDASTLEFDIAILKPSDSTDMIKMIKY